MHSSTRLALVMTIALLSVSVARGQFRANPNASSETNEADRSTRFQFDPPQPATVRKVNKTLLTGMLRGIGPDGVEFTLNTGAAFTYPLNTVQVVRLTNGTWSFTPKTGELEAAVTAARIRFPEAKPPAAAAAAAAPAAAHNAGTGGAGANFGGRQIPFTSLPSPNPNPAFGPTPSGAHGQPNPGSLPTTLPSMAHASPSMAHTPTQPTIPPANTGSPFGGAGHSPAAPAIPSWTYEYSCTKCGHRWESQSSTEHLTGSCPKCGQRGRFNQSAAAATPRPSPFPANTNANPNDGSSTFRIPRGSIRGIVMICTFLFAGVAGLVRWLNTGYYDRPHVEEEEEDKYRPRRRRSSRD